MIQTDIAIVGGGITGLWLLNLLASQGYRTLLFEKNHLGSGQTLASQGMLHGGLKYDLAGVTTSASKTIAGMPEIWRRCLAGVGSPNLQQVRCLTNQYHLFSDASLSSKVTTYFGSRLVRGGPRQLSREAFPEPFNQHGFGGNVYEIPDIVLDTSSLISVLAAPYVNYLFEASPVPSPREHEPGISKLVLADGTEVNAQYFIFAAGTGNEDLLMCSHIAVAMQRRPLCQVLLKGALPPVFGHAVSLRAGDKPRMTITSHRASDGEIIWYLGGDLAESGVNRSDKEQIEFAQQELSQIFPSVNTTGCRFATWRVDRAEPRQNNRKRPDRPYCEQLGNVLVCWPIKMTLVPLLAADVLANIKHKPLGLTNGETGHLTKATLGESPWEGLF